MELNYQNCKKVQGVAISKYLLEMAAEKRLPVIGDSLPDLIHVACPADRAGG
jgi:hypothetical protein